MKMDRRHLAVSLTLLAGSVVYNVWASATPVDGPPPAVPSVQPRPAAPPAPAAGAPPPVTSHRSTAAVDVMLERPPVWARDPFTGRGAPQLAMPAISQLPAAAAPAAEPELVLNSVLYSPARRLAMVNGRTVRVGGRIGGLTVVDILPDAIVVESASGEVRTIERRQAAAGRPRR